MEGYTSILKAAVPEVKTEQAGLLVNRYRVLGGGGRRSRKSTTSDTLTNQEVALKNLQSRRTKHSGRHKPRHAGQHVCGGLDP